MKKIIALLVLAVTLIVLQSCDSLASMSNEDAYRTGYNTGVWLRGGDKSEYIK
ncbi:MAG: hypothetical protein IJ064_06870 [Bacteroidaceae bacterium]|nr:hypothetical protein [Bacteroidaceae bacterium]